MKHLSWYSSPTGEMMGYGYAAVSLIQALQREQVRVDFLNEDAPVHISFIQPEWYQTPSKSQYSIGYTPWESSEIPDSWPEYMQAVDEIWTTSSYCKDVYAKYGIESTVVPHGIDPEVFQINERTLTDKFVFFHAGSPTERKGSQYVVDAFLELFGTNDDVILLLKSTGPTNARWVGNSQYHGNAGNHPRIHVVEFDISHEDMAQLYYRSHCFVYPSRGEGFGLLPFQALATGVPTILTNATGMTDFAHYGIPLKWKETKGYGIHLGNWAEPDYEDLKVQMLSVFNNWGEYNKKAIQNARIIHNTQTWGHIAKDIITLLGDKINV